MCIRDRYPAGSNHFDNGHAQHFVYGGKQYDQIA